MAMRASHVLLPIVGAVLWAAPLPASAAGQEAAPIPGVDAADLARFEGGLRQAGATDRNLAEYEQTLRDESPAEREESIHLMRTASPEYFSPRVVSMRRGAALGALERPPQPLFAHVRPVRGYDSLKGVTIPNTTIDQVILDPDGWCRVVATVRHPPATDQVRVYVALPVQGWNGRFLGTGGGGFAGGSPTSLRWNARSGFAVAATDTGHDTPNGSFALDKNGHLDWQQVIDFSSLGIHEMTLVGKGLVRAFYGRPPGRSYFMGGSTGGREALMEAQRYPEDYDGIVAVAPALYFNHLKFAQLWPQFVMTDARHFVSKAKLIAVTAAAVRDWKTREGTSDDYISDPRRSHFDAKAFVGTDVDGETFNDADADVVNRMWAGPRQKNGSFLWYGLMRGAELQHLGGTTGKPLHGQPYSMAVDWVRYFLLQDPTWDEGKLTQAGFERLLDESVRKFGTQIETADPDLARFRDHGGKLIIWHGWADQIIPPEGTIRYFEQVERRMGGGNAVAAFARLFMVPGVAHCGGGNGPQPFGLGAAIRRWVEEGEAPERLTAEMFDGEGRPTGPRTLEPFEDPSEHL